MADKSFGIKELNLLSSGTPKIESATTLDITATTTTFSGGATFGGNVELNSGTDLRVQLNSTEGAIELSRATGGAYIDFKNSTSEDYDTRIAQDGTNAGLIITGDLSVSGTLSGGNGAGAILRWTLGANGSSDYTFTGPGGLSGTADPKLYLARGHTYEFVNNSGGSHPFQIQDSGGSPYNTGVNNNGASSGTITFSVPFSAPNTLQYKCTSHSSMGNTIIIYPDLSP
tara:strand:- start:233 stop:916 length:684 start_codon:yes stop_codon:yes gene_type:complete